MKNTETSTWGGIIMPAALLVACFICVQLHAIVYWQSVVGEDAMGIAWSITIEAIAVFFWMQSKSENNIKLLWIAVPATILAMAAPFAKNASPVFDEMALVSGKIDTWEDKRLSYQRQVESAYIEHASAITKSEERRGWKDSIDEAGKDSTEAESALLDHLDNKPSYLSVLDEQFKVLTILVAVAVLQFASIVLARIIGSQVKVKQHHDVGDIHPEGDIDRNNGVAKSCRDDSESSEKVEDRGNVVDINTDKEEPKNKELTNEEKQSVISVISEKVLQYQKDHQITTAANMSKVLGLSGRDTSLLLNFEDLLRRKESGEKSVRMISYPKAVEAASRIGYSEADFLQLKKAG